MTVEALLIWIVVGLVAGWLASLIVGGSRSLLGDIVVGIVGAFLGGFLASALGLPNANINQGNFSLTALIVSFVGAVILLAIVNLVRRGSTR